MTEWNDPRYTETVARYQAAKTAAGPRKRRPGWSKRRRYGDPFVIVVDTATLTPYNIGR